MTDICSPADPPLTSLSHGGGCGCKIAPGILSDLLKGSFGMALPEELLVGAATSDDAAVYKLNENQALVATTDFFMPIVNDPFDFGRIAATNAISDVYAMGGRPILALALVAMPLAKLSRDAISRILQGGSAACTAAGIPIAGGHTIDSVEPIYGLVAIGLVHPDRVRKNGGSAPGDVLVLGKPLGTGIMAGALKKGRLDAPGYDELIATTTALNTPGPDLAALEGVHGLTDVTGFGLAGHALEMARGAGCTLRIDWDQVPVMGPVRALLGDFATGAARNNWDSYGHEVGLPAGFCDLERALLTDPQTSGGLLVSCAPDTVGQVMDIFRSHGFARAAVIGDSAAAGPEGPRVILR